jgi:hypothetical protein
VTQIVLNPFLRSALRNIQKWLGQQAALAEDVAFEASLMETGKAIADALKSPSRCGLSWIQTRLETNSTEAGACGFESFLRMLKEEQRRLDLALDL